MTRAGFAWECACGTIEYMEEEPEECLKCGGLDSFIKMPEEILEEREKDLIAQNTENVSLSKNIPVKKLKTSKRKKK